MPIGSSAQRSSCGLARVEGEEWGCEAQVRVAARARPAWHPASASAGIFPPAASAATGWSAGSLRSHDSWLMTEGPCAHWTRRQLSLTERMFFLLLFSVAAPSLILLCFIPATVSCCFAQHLCFAASPSNKVTIWDCFFGLAVQHFAHCGNPYVCDTCNRCMHIKI